MIPLGRRPSVLRSAAAAMLASGAHGTALFADVTVIRRSGAEPITGSSAVATEQGVAVAMAGAAGSAGTVVSGDVIPWDMVRSVEGSPAVAGVGEFGAAAEDLWRARIRIERGDDALAAPMFRSYWDRFASGDGPTSALVIEGALRCALARSDAQAAVEPWIACLRLGARGGATRFPDSEPVVDPMTGLLPAISPFVPAARREELALAFDRVGTEIAGPEALPVARRFAALLRAIDGRPSDQAVRVSEGPVSPAAGVAMLLLEIVEAPSEKARDEAARAFRKAMDKAPGFLESWRLAAVGANAALRARAIVAGEPARAPALERAALEMLAVPASELDPTGLVDCFALEEAGRLLREAGDAVAAAQLETLLEERSRRVLARTGSQSESVSAEQSGPPESQTGSSRPGAAGRARSTQ